MIGVPDGVLNSSLHSEYVRTHVERIQHSGAAALQKKLDSLAGLGIVGVGIGFTAGTGELVAISGWEEVCRALQFGTDISETGSIVDRTTRSLVSPNHHRKAHAALSR